MKIKTSELTGPALRYCVAKCENPEWGEEGWRVNCTYPDDDGWIFHPDTDWSQGGPIIDREDIDIISVGVKNYRGRIEGGNPTSGYGPTRLIAAMRCFVASRLGSEVEVPDELA